MTHKLSAFENLLFAFAETVTTFRVFPDKKLLNTDKPPHDGRTRLSEFICSTILGTFEEMVSKFGACASFNVSPFDSIIYETIESELITLAGNWPLRILRLVAETPR